MSIGDNVNVTFVNTKTSSIKGLANWCSNRGLRYSLSTVKLPVTETKLRQLRLKLYGKVVALDIHASMALERLGYEHTVMYLRRQK